jgi:hypothetical protein
MIHHDTARFVSTLATDVTDARVIVGYGSTGARSHGLVWSATKTSSTGVTTAYNLYGGTGASDFGSAVFGINNTGVMAGTAGVRWESQVFGTSYNSVPATTTGGGWSEIPIPPTTSGSSTTRYGGRAFAINDEGLILGLGGPGADRPWLSTGGAPAPQLEMLAGPHGLNGEGHVAGRTFGPATGSFTARVWNGASFDEIGAQQAKSVAYAINDADWAVGRAGADDLSSYPTAGNAWLWRPEEAASPLYLLAGTGWSMYSATDITDDGLIVGVGRYAGESVGFWMAPANLAHTVSGTVRGPDGLPAAGVRVKAVGPDGGVIGSAVTGPDGRYTLTLPRANGYSISVEPDGSYLPDAAAGCNELVGSVCKLNLARNRTIDFYAAATTVPDLPLATGGGPSGGGASNAPTSSPSPSPVVKLAGKSTLSASAKGVVTLGLAPFAADTTGTVVLKTAGKVKIARAKVLTLGSAKFRAKAGKKVRISVRLSGKAKKLLKRGKLKAVATVTARSAGSAQTVTTLKLTVKR